MSDYICEDLLPLILKWLPVKPLLQWRCVCKSWKLLIDSKPFILDHLSLQRSRLVVQTSKTKYLLFGTHDSLPLFDTVEGPELTQRNHSRYRCSDGPLVDSLGYLCGVSSGVICLYDNATNLLLWNPSIRHLLRIPPPDIYAHDTIDDFKYCGFWMDPSNSGFKIVIFDFHSTRVELFSSTPLSWVSIDMGHLLRFEELDIYCEAPQVLIEGVAHWTAFTNDTLMELVVVFFDFGQDKLGTLDLPKQFINTPHDITLSKWHDFLSFVWWEDTSPYGCEIWAMQNGSWSKMLTLNLMNGIMNVFYVFEDWGRILASTSAEELVLYDAKDGSFLLNVSFQEHGVFSYATDFVESLVFPDRKCISSTD